MTKTLGLFSAASVDVRARAVSRTAAHTTCSQWFANVFLFITFISFDLCCSKSCGLVRRPRMIEVIQLLKSNTLVLRKNCVRLRSMIVNDFCVGIGDDWKKASPLTGKVVPNSD